MSEPMMPDSHPLPSWVDSERLKSQRPIVDEVVDRFKGRNGHRKHDVVFLQAPTGTGKSLIAELVRRQLRTNAIYTCTTKALQDQFAKDFGEYAKVLKGRSNYPTALGLVDEVGNTVLDLSDAVTALDCTGANEECQWCGIDWGQCPYLRARGRARSADVAVLNTAFMLTDAMGSRRFTNRGLTIIDEADKLEDELLNFVSVELSRHRRGRLGIGTPRLKTKEDTWVEYIRDEALPAIKRYQDVLGELEDAKDRHTIREIKMTGELAGKLRNILKGSMYGRWVYDGYTAANKQNDHHPVIFRPVYVNEYGEQYVWKMGYRFLLMSATILADGVMANELGIPDRFVYGTVEVPSVFPKENRPIHVVPVANMSYKAKDEDRPKMARAISGVLRRHPDERILIHCVSYDLANYLYGELRTMDHSRPLLIYYKSAEKDSVLDRYRNSDRSVLFAASMERGIDLPDDACRVQVIAKVPYPNLGDRRVERRLFLPGGQSWFDMNTVRAIVQASGRAVRHREDYAVTYVLDSQFVELWKNNSRLFPKYFKEALNFRFNPRLLTEV